MHLYIFVVMILLVSTSSSKTVITKPIVFLSTAEGLSSHIIQIELLWGRARAVNRGVQVVDFYSHHYPDTGRVNICKLFIYS